MVVLEITAFRGNRAQWNSAEASSVPDHIVKFKRNNPTKKIIGLFTAPSIHHQLEQNLRLNARKENVGMIFKPCTDLSKLLVNIDRNKLKDMLLNEVDIQLKHPEKSDLFFSDVILGEQIEGVDKSEDYLPIYDLEAIATSFKEQTTPKIVAWKPMSGHSANKEEMFIARVVGKSMESTIPDGSWCLFRFERGGSRNGKVVLVESRLVADPETNQSFTIKRYYSEKEDLGNGQWRHKKIVLSPDNKAFKDIVLENVSGEDFRVVAEFVEVLT
jgi:SOS-response transcriptional repressor LexA